MSISEVELVSLIDDLNISTLENRASADVFRRHYVWCVRRMFTSLGNFLRGYMPDPVVGDAACQVRAALLCEKANDPALVAQLNAVLPIIGQYADAGSTESGRRALDQATINQHVIPIGLARMIKILFYSSLSEQSSLILMGQGILICQETNIAQTKTKMGIEDNISQAFANALVKTSKRYLSSESILYLQDVLNKLNSSLCDEPNYAGLIKGDLVKLIPTTGVQTYLFLEGVNIILKNIQLLGITVILRNHIVNTLLNQKIGSITMRYGVNKDNAGYSLQQDSSASPVFVVECVAFTQQRPFPFLEMAEMLREIGIEQILLANAAAHPQYPHGVDALVPVSAEAERLSRFAEQAGLSMRNPSLCRVFHIYAGALQAEEKVFPRMGLPIAVPDPNYTL